MDNFDALISDCNYANFNEIALKIFHFQAENCIVLKNYLHFLGKNPKKIKKVEDIVYLPIQFFKSHEVKSHHKNTSFIFESSGTGGERSKHLVLDAKVYENAFLHCFENHFGNHKNFAHLALLPNYQEQGNSSLVYMVNHFIENTKERESAFFLSNFDALKAQLQSNMQQKQHTILWGVTFALLDFAKETKGLDFEYLTIIETGGMKGRGKELTRNELHLQLSKAFPKATISSEYGMTELFSQAYWNAEYHVFESSPTLKIVIRDVNDPFRLLGKNRHGAINVIDLTNWQTCSFIETSDLGILREKGFEVLGRLDSAEIRGCSLMYV